MADTRSQELKRAEAWLAEAFAEMTDRYTRSFPYSPTVAAAVVRSYMVAAAISAINEEVELDTFLDVARHAYRFALEQTREVEAEDGN